MSIIHIFLAPPPKKKCLEGGGQKKFSILSPSNKMSIVARLRICASIKEVILSINISISRYLQTYISTLSLGLFFSIFFSLNWQILIYPTHDNLTVAVFIFNKYLNILCDVLLSDRSSVFNIKPGWNSRESIKVLGLLQYMYLHMYA